MLNHIIKLLLFIRFRSNEVGRRRRFSRSTDSILKQLIKEALDIVLEECRDHRSLPPKLSRHISSLKGPKLKYRLHKERRRRPNIHCRNVRVLLYYVQQLFC